LRSVPRTGIVSAMNWMTIPSMLGPMVGPVVGGFLTDYASWRWIFFLNIPMGLLGFALALWFFENFRAPAPTRFDLVGFVIAGVALFMLELAIENVGRPMIPPALGLAFFPLAAVMLFTYWHHAGHSSASVLDLSLLSIKTFNIGTMVGGVCRVGLDATPFMLPLLFQVGFGLSATEAGLLTFSSTKTQRIDTSVGGPARTWEIKGFQRSVASLLVRSCVGQREMQWR
jgi:MFS family permease